MQTQEKKDTRQLTNAQRIVCELVRRGLRECEIARELGRSSFTVNNHMRKIYAAYGVHSRSMLLVKLFEQERGGAREKTSLEIAKMT